MVSTTDLNLGKISTRKVELFMAGPTIEKFIGWSSFPTNFACRSKDYMNERFSIESNK